MPLAGQGKNKLVLYMIEEIQRWPIGAMVTTTVRFVFLVDFREITSLFSYIAARVCARARLASSM